MNPFATIIVPTFNQAQYIEQALNSLLAQTDIDWEAVVVNDGSTDSTAEIIEGYAANDPRIRIIHKKNGGVASALNRGLMEARGCWIHWLSSDDIFEPEKLAINRRWIEANPDCNFFFSYFTLLTESSGKRESRELWGQLPNPEYQIIGLLYRNYINGISICVNREAWAECGYFDNELYYAQDYDQWLRLLSKNRGIFIPEWTVVSRNHAEQGSEKFPDACYFDTAKAAISFINNHSFSEIVPWSDLSDEKSASLAILAALEVACDSSSFLYCLGPNPALILRILEWVFSSEHYMKMHGAMVCDRIREMSLANGDGDDWSWMWAQLALSLAGECRRIKYSRIDPKIIAVNLCYARQLSSELAHLSIRDYLRQFMSVSLDIELLPKIVRPRIVFFVNTHTEKIPEVIDFSRLLTTRNYRPLIILIDGHNEISSYALSSGISVISLSSLDKNTLPWLGEFELAVSLNAEILSFWTGAKQKIIWDGTDPDNFYAQNLSTIFDRNIDAEARVVIFLERVLWAGGAERVVHEVVRNLNRNRYRPIILTLFDEHCQGSALQSDVEILNINNEAFDTAVESNLTPIRSQSWVLIVLRRLLKLSRATYHKLFGKDFREYIGVGRRIRKMKLILTSAMSPDIKPSTEKSKISGEINSKSELNSTVDFSRLMSHYNPLVNRLIHVMGRFPANSVLITIMEEATITAWLARASLQQPYIASLHTVESECIPRLFPNNDQYLAEKWMLAEACKASNTVIFPGEGAARDLSENFGVAMDKITTIWNPVNCMQIRRQSKQRDEHVLTWVEVAKTKFKMVHVGRLDGEKNHELLLEICVELKKRGRAFSLAIVGEGRDRHWIEQKILKENLQEQVFLVGQQKNPYTWMAAADTLILTSRFESFALVLVEAMACGTAVVSVDCPTGPGEILKNGAYGVLVENYDANAFATAVETLMDDEHLRMSMVETGYARVGEFDVKTIIPKWEELLDRMSELKAPAKTT